MTSQVTKDSDQMKYIAAIECYNLVIVIYYVLVKLYEILYLFHRSESTK